jgi:hypothetical protein
LTYAITKKNKHNSRINISVNYKIVINSPEVCFGTKRQYAKAGFKNLTILAPKIIYANPAEMENIFYKTIYNVWYRS